MFLPLPGLECMSYHQPVDSQDGTAIWNFISQDSQGSK